MLSTGRYLARMLCALSLFAGVLSVRGAARGEFGSLFDPDGPSSSEVNQLLQRHPDCGALVLYSSVANEHPELLLENLDTASAMASALAANYENYAMMVEAFRIIALHLSEGRETVQFRVTAYWRRTCDKMEKCDNEEASSPACQSAWSAVENFDY